jgi:hypothetical protein
MISNFNLDNPNDFDNTGDEMITNEMQKIINGVRKID